MNKKRGKPIEKWTKALNKHFRMRDTHVAIHILNVLKLIRHQGTPN